MVFLAQQLASSSSEIVTLESAPEVRMTFGTRQANVYAWCAILRQREGRALPPRDFRPRGAVCAEVNRGRWIARCPLCGPGAMLVSRADPRFWCVTCGMAANGGQPMQVLFPAEQRTIETILLMRPVENRNWQPGEGVAALARENLEHGCINWGIS
jgi:ribosomal protein S27AE